MSVAVALNVFSVAAISFGVFFFLAGTVGLLRFPDTLTRLHALTKADNLGLGLIMLGLLPLRILRFISGGAARGTRRATLAARGFVGTLRLW
jgi:monovalent cation/proton antiporter MnhG/PhaG subunit